MLQPLGSNCSGRVVSPTLTRSVPSIWAQKIENFFFYLVTCLPSRCLSSGSQALLGSRFHFLPRLRHGSLIVLHTLAPPPPAPAHAPGSRGGPAIIFNRSRTRRPFLPAFESESQRCASAILLIPYKIPFSHCCLCCGHSVVIFLRK
jgi:hypothetical protein